MKAIANHATLGKLVGQFLSEMHRFDAGRTLPVLHAARVTTPQLAVLEFVRTPRTVSAIAQHVGLSKPATSQMVQKLVQQHLVQRSEGATDRRERAVELTSAGQVLLGTIEAARAARFDASLAQLPPRIAARLESALAATVHSLRREHASPPARPPRKASR
jgi:MarR family transcriptional regulator, organic hydroperoxide resistance regulator